MLSLPFESSLEVLIFTYKHLQDKLLITLLWQRFLDFNVHTIIWRSC